MVECAMRFPTRQGQGTERDEMMPTGRGSSAKAECNGTQG